MNRGELYRVRKPGARDPKASRVFVVASRNVLISSKFSTVICAPIYSVYEGLSTQVPVGPEAGLKHASSIHCDELVSLPKIVLTDYVGSLDDKAKRALAQALLIALEIESC